MAVIAEDVALLGSGNDLVHGTLIRPSLKERRHGLVILGDAFGLTDHFREIARRLARAGYTALALDMFSRTGPPDARPMKEDARQVVAFVDQLPDGQVLGDVQSAAAWLRRRSDASGRVGCIGFSLGGLYAQMAMAVADGPDVGVSVYGRLRYSMLSAEKPNHPIERARQTRGPLLAMFGAKDRWIPSDQVNALRHTLTQAKQPFDVHVYNDVGHGFFDDTKPEFFSPGAAADAWRRALNWFARHLGPVDPDPAFSSRRW